MISTLRRRRPGALRRIIVIATAVLAAPSMLTVAPRAVDAAPASPVEEQAFFRLLNQERASRGVPPLVFDPALAATARTWSATMRPNLYHDPNRRSQILAVEPAATAWAENVGEGPSVQAIHNKFLTSEEHFENMINPIYNRVGIGVVRSSSTIWVTVRFLRGPTSGGSCTSTPIGSVIAADLDGDKTDDVTVNRSGTACDRVYTGRSAAKFSVRSVVIGGTYVPVAGNFDRRIGDEVLWYAPGTATDYLSKWTGTTFNSIPQTINGTAYRPYSGDFDGDDRDDILWYTPGPGGDYIWYGTSTFGRFDSRPLTVNGFYEVTVTDLDGDGRDDINWYGPGPDRPDYVHYSLGRGRYTSVAVTTNGYYQPLAGDFDGDKRGDILWYAPGSSQDYVWYGHGRRGQYDSRAVTINGTYRPVTGDFDGDRRSDVLWMRADPVGSPLWLGRVKRGTFTDARFHL